MALKPILFRFHRGSLDESLKTTIVIPDGPALGKALKDAYGDEKYEVNFYTHDKRPNMENWLNTFSVSIGGNIVGFITSEEIP